MSSGAISREVEGFALDIILNVLELSVESLAAFCSQPALLAVKYKSDGKEFIKEDRYPSKDQCFTLSEIAKHFASHSDYPSHFRSKLLLLIIAVHGDLSVAVEVLIQSAASKLETAESIVAIANYAFLAGRRDLGGQLYEEVLSRSKDQLNRLLADYTYNIRVYTQHEKITNRYTGASEEPDERIMRRVEKQADISESYRDDFRREVMTKIGAMAIAGKTFAYNSMPILKRAPFKCVIGFDPSDLWVDPPQ